MYAAGQGAPRDLVAAYECLARAAGSGMAAAGPYLKRVAGKMTPAQLGQVQGLEAA
jgi:uncharacterized protein